MEKTHRSQILTKEEHKKSITIGKGVNLISNQGNANQNQDKSCKLCFPLPPNLTANIYYLTVPVGQEFEGGLAG